MPTALILLFWLLLFAQTDVAKAGGVFPPTLPTIADDQTDLCRTAIAAAEAQTHIPDAFLAAIGRVESGLRNSAGRMGAWPWTINAAGQGHFYASKAAAVAAARQFIGAGMNSIDVGCLQVNIAFHPDAFASLDQAFDPDVNAAYAARLLMTLFRGTGSWPLAAAAYHSRTPAIGQAYQEKVLAAWALPDFDTPSGHINRAGTRGPALPVFSSASSAPDQRLPYRASSALGRPDPLLPDRLASTPGGAPTLATVQPADPAPPRQYATGAGVPVAGYTRNMRIAGPAQARTGTGRTLASYRVFPVREALRLSGPGPIPRGGVAAPMQ